MAGHLTAALDASALSTFREAFAGQIVLPDDPSYDGARIVWNGMIDRRPAVVVRPTGVADVLAALRFARDQELPIAVRSGGHSIPGFSTCDRRDRHRPVEHAGRPGRSRTPGGAGERRSAPRRPRS